MSLTILETHLLDLLASMVRQNCASDHEEMYDSGCISIHRDAMQMLVKQGLATCVFPEEDAEDYPWRWYHIKFVPNWVHKLYGEKL